MINSLYAELVANSKKHIREITIEQAKEQLISNTPPLLIDVRETHEWEKGHLPNAIHLSKGMLEVSIEKHAPDVNSPIILYCGKGGRAALAAYNLQRMGYTHVLSIDGGITAWGAAGYDIVID